MKNYIINPRGHVWITAREKYPELYEERDPGGYADEPYAFAVDHGFHNGPECKNCELSFCEHCQPYQPTEDCPNQPKQ